MYSGVLWRSRLFVYFPFFRIALRRASKCNRQNLNTDALYHYDSLILACLDSRSSPILASNIVTLRIALHRTAHRSTRQR